MGQTDNAALTVIRERSRATLSTVAVAVVTGSGSTTTGHRPRVVLAHGKERLPSTTAQDRVSHGDRTVVGTVASETRLPASDEEVEAGEGCLSRTVTERQAAAAGPQRRPRPARQPHDHRRRLGLQGVAEDQQLTLRQHRRPHRRLTTGRDEQTGSIHGQERWDVDLTSDHLRRARRE